MRAPQKSAEQGQSLVIFAMAAVALLAFAGLALDGGWLVVQRRRAQNTADNAALAAAMLKAHGLPAGDYIAEGLEVAATNNYNNDGESNTVTVVSPPESGAFSGNGNYVQVIIEQAVPTSFIQLVYSGPVELTVSAVARAVPSDENPVVTGQAIVGLHKTACDTVAFTGSGHTYITGGGVFSNSTSPGTTCYSGQKSNASGSLTVETGGINMVSDWTQNSNAVVSPAPTLGVEQITYPPVPVPPCYGPGMTDKGGFSISNGSATITPGRYDRIVVNPSASLTMAPGLYCITGSGSNAKFDISGDLYADGVHIYIGPNAAGSFSTNAGGTIYMTAPTDANCAAPASASPPTTDVCDQVGLILHQDAANTNTIRINGGAETTYIGTFFAPSALININGGSGTAGVFNSQIIGSQVQVQGNADITIHYIPEQNYKAPQPPRVWLAE